MTWYQNRGFNKLKNNFTKNLFKKRAGLGRGGRGESENFPSPAKMLN